MAMPGDVIERILSFLDSKSVTRASCVARAWHDASRAPWLWARLCEHHFRSPFLRTRADYIRQWTITRDTLRLHMAMYSVFFDQMYLLLGCASATGWLFGAQPVLFALRLDGLDDSIAMASARPFVLLPALYLPIKASVLRLLYTRLRPLERYVLSYAAEMRHVMLTRDSCRLFVYLAGGCGGLQLLPPLVQLLAALPLSVQRSPFTPRGPEPHRSTTLRCLVCLLLSALSHAVAPTTSLALVPLSVGLMLYGRALRTLLWRTSLVDAMRRMVRDGGFPPILTALLWYLRYTQWLPLPYTLLLLVEYGVWVADGPLLPALERVFRAAMAAPPLVRGSSPRPCDSADDDYRATVARA
ncbi:hypothetical protein SPRG_19214 [Saprolegnia parasitica CBS 223.65]|uniref:F-box domain-containing protein n=1 Tax=Saprolegnia parasitica (strain CBS 223.65) TaxID=695850 RepID=A0A067CST5_SAPPC|nr:hypothetical protein SPRG_19214 [Saprolegnia parasitica CBS 223.65]KDO33583.1 hypothetical protein SPRG_19214 [Saprolegnia parasitica CBS 223.65]|eukprot:XP_012195635.1 hypothetical protein SPRG_19214 [Saprolegnia parasitica CBS 223.65]